MNFGLKLRCMQIYNSVEFFFLVFYCFVRVQQLGYLVVTGNRKNSMK